MISVWWRKQNRRWEELMARNNTVIERNAVAFEGHTAAYERHAAILAELIKAVQDVQDEMRAQRQALLALLDRFENGGTAPA
jgi:bifunctional pyridoxal-dependent enzyme with beta-cystathionase and maltose regulon repressor activities